jgi:CBS domain-containing protein
MKNLLVRDWMTPHPITIDPQTTLPDAYSIMKECGVRRLPVVHRRELVGIVTVNDIRSAAPMGSIEVTGRNSMFRHTRVRQVMTRQVVTIRPDAPLAEAARRMMDKKFAGLPVMEDGELVGILTESDIFRMLVQELESGPPESVAL